jgi:SAM-dependent methyltransferase
VDTPDDLARRGWRDYSPLFLRIYDLQVLGIFAPFIWRCPAKDMTAGYRRNMRGRHLDVGPGTGYFLEPSRRPAVTSLTILDPNPNVLRHVTRRLRDVPLTAVEADVLKPLPINETFDSVGMNGVIHCLPGPPERKEQAIENIAAVLAPDGVFFGSTVLGRSGNHSWVARRVLGPFNRRGAFDNLGDSEDWLRSALERRFGSVEIEVVGSMAIFAARNPRNPGNHSASAGPQ